MNEQNKPNFAAWNCQALAKLADTLWDDNMKLRDTNERLRLDIKDLLVLFRKTANNDDWK